MRSVEFRGGKERNSARAVTRKKCANRATHAKKPIKIAARDVRT